MSTVLPGTTVPNTIPAISYSTLCGTSVVHDHYKSMLPRLSLSMKRDPSLLFEILVLQQSNISGPSSCRDLSTMNSLLGAMDSSMKSSKKCNSSNNNSNNNTIKDGDEFYKDDCHWPTDMTHLKEDIINKFMKYIAKPTNKGILFCQICSIISSILDIIVSNTGRDISSLSQHSSDEKFTATKQSITTTTSPTNNHTTPTILWFMFVVLNESINNLLEHLTTLPYPQTGNSKEWIHHNHELACAYMRLADICSVWRRAAVSFIEVGTSYVENSKPEGDMCKHLNLSNHFKVRRNGRDDKRDMTKRCGLVMQHIGNSFVYLHYFPLLLQRFFI